MRRIEKVDLMNSKGVIIWPYAITEKGDIDSKHKSYKGAKRAFKPELITWKPALVKKFIEYNAPVELA